MRGERWSAVADDDDVAIVAEALRRVGELDMEGALALTTDDLHLELPFRNDGGPRVMDGADAARFFRSLNRLFDRMHLYDIVVHGQLPSGLVVAEYRSDGLTKQGRSYPNVYVAMFELRDGKISVWREFFDPNVVTAAFG
jgi:ketosteroid isomerase-like protein